MEFSKKSYKVKELVSAWSSGSMIKNQEYQRGEAWTLSQKQALVDSLFRTYPIPPLFLEHKLTVGLGGSTSEKYEIIDGQQRLLALSEFYADNFLLLRPDDKKLRLPVSLRPSPAPWAEKRYTGLDAALRETLDETDVDVYIVSEVNHPDEVRDLFIRLQSGTALTRQQVRDAWPGKLGPFVEAAAGKLDKRPKYQFFQLIDGRGLRDEEGDSKDRYVKHRQTCAQLLRTLLERLADPTTFATITAADLDGLYHTYTDIDPNGDQLKRVVQVFDSVEDVCLELNRMQGRVYKINKQSMYALCVFFLDSYRNEQFKMDTSSIKALAKYVANQAPKATGKSSSASENKSYYDLWRRDLPESIGVKLDAKRLFDATQKYELWERAAGKCEKCGDELEINEGEADHYPIPHRDGGRTVVENGRFVCLRCHPRGRPKAGSAGA